VLSLICIDRNGRSTEDSAPDGPIRLDLTTVRGSARPHGGRLGQSSRKTPVAAMAHFCPARTSEPSRHPRPGPFSPTQSRSRQSLFWLGVWSTRVHPASFLSNWPWPAPMPAGVILRLCAAGSMTVPATPALGWVARHICWSCGSANPRPESEPRAQASGADGQRPAPARTPHWHAGAL